MPLFLPQDFADTDLGTLDRLLAESAFVTLLHVHDAAPQVSHVPVLYARDGETITLLGHIARANPQASAESAVTVIVHGPDHYLSPAWYPDKESAGRVPTWNYVVAHLEGRLTWFDDPAALGDLVHAMSRHFEPKVGADWDFDPTEPRFAKQLRGIVGFRIDVQQVTIKSKLSQNHPVANQRAVSEALQRLQTPAATRMQVWMDDRIKQETNHDES